WPAGARLLSRGRPGRGDGLSGASIAREHRQRVVPASAARRCAARAAPGAAVSATAELPPFTNEPLLELRRGPVRDALLEALRELDRMLPLRVPIVVGGDAGADEGIDSTDPGAPSRLVANAGRATDQEATAAVTAGERGYR